MRFVAQYLIVIVVLAGCSKPQPKDFSFEVFPGISLKVDPLFKQSHKNKAGFYFTVFLENKTDKGVYLNHWDASLVSTNLGNGTSRYSKIIAEKAFIESGGKHPLHGYLYIGPKTDDKYPDTYLSQAVGKDENHLSMLSSERAIGDCLVGLVMSIQVGDDRKSDLYLVKYHYDESADAITPYFVLGEYNNGFNVEVEKNK